MISKWSSMQGVFDMSWHCVGESQRKKINIPKEVPMEDKWFN